MDIIFEAGLPELDKTGNVWIVRDGTSFASYVTLRQAVIAALKRYIDKSMNCSPNILRNGSDVMRWEVVKKFWDDGIISN